MTFLKTRAARRFTATLIATATALALMTAAAVPARADRQSDDFAKAVAAIAAIAIIGSALNEKEDRRAPPVVVPPRPQEAHSPRRRGDDYTAPRWGRRAIILPAECAVEVRGRRHSGIAYPERCLRRAGIDRHLPQQCEVVIHMRGRDRIAYDQNCLLNSGFRTQGRGRRF